ncbi:hypothetical protein RHMOL_Rhmol05G0319300 [Rhododendron molle]|uniref:Uncharacterized protein n=1 Tax=Rhododendron molle TaxID=49168 RepID=A0ACC0NVH2_RHOML|nr:hypothetical protein RHMOL_Rhmol05G0319300 [Rhododendron molle]
MAIMRTRSLLTSPSEAPPPSPIPTGKGLRSAANSIFSENLSRSLKIPKLSLPEYVHRSVPADIDRESLASREPDSVKRILRCAAEFGVFRISRHGICVEELRSALGESDAVFRIPDCKNKDCRQNYGGREEFVWRRFEKAAEEWTRKVIGAVRYRRLSQMIDSVAKQLEAIAGELAEVISQGANKQLIHKGIQPRESTLSLYRYDHDAFMGEPPPLSSDRHRESRYEHAISLHLLVDQCEFHVQSERGPLSFNAGPDTIVVTIGTQLEEWSLGEFKSAHGHGELTFEPNLSSTRASFSIELNCSPSRFSHGFGKINKTILIADQILFISIIALVCNIFMFIFY